MPGESTGSAEDAVRAIAADIAGDIRREGFRGCAFLNAAAEYPDPAHPVHRRILEHREWFLGAVTDLLGQVGDGPGGPAGRHFVMLRDGRWWPAACPSRTRCARRSSTASRESCGREPWPALRGVDLPAGAYQPWMACRSSASRSGTLIIARWPESSHSTLAFVIAAERSWNSGGISNDLR